MPELGGSERRRPAPCGMLTRLLQLINRNDPIGNHMINHDNHHANHHDEDEEEMGEAGDN